MRCKTGTARTLLLGALLSAACGDSVTRTEDVALAASPQTVTVRDTGAAAIIYLTTEPSGRLQYQVSAKPDWLTVTPMSGVIDRNIVQLALRVVEGTWHETGLAGLLEVVSEGGVARVNVQTALTPSPVAAATGPLVVSGTTDTTSFLLANSGRGTLQWSTAPSAGWLGAQPSSGTLATGASTRIIVTANKTPLPAGSHAGSLIIQSNSVAGAVTLPVQVTVDPIPVATTSTLALSVPAGSSSGAFTLRNTGKGALDWTTQNGAAWLTSTPAAGTLAPGDSAMIQVHVDRSALGYVDVSSAVTVQSNSANGAIQVGVAVIAEIPWSETLTMLNHRVVDAEYNAATGRIVTVSAGPTRLNLIDPLSGAVQHVNLTRSPTAVSVRPDGAFAAVGHDGAISFVDLTTLTVTRVYDVSTDVLDVVLPANGWVYAFPRRDQWEKIRSIELATGDELISTGYQIYAGTVARLHPSGDFMYGADNHLSPSDFEKYDISSGNAAYMYDSPYHGDFEFGGDLWISGDGLRLYARSGAVFRSSTVQAEDMKYMGSLAGATALAWASDDAAADRIYVLANGGANTREIKIHRAATLTRMGELPLPPFFVNGNRFAAEGRYVFAGQDGAIHILQRADPASGLSLDWALVTIGAQYIP